jgi:hypothetical protein
VCDTVSRSRETDVLLRPRKVEAVAHIVVRMVVATSTEAWSWLNPAVRSLLLRRSEWSAVQDFVGTRGGGAAGRTKPV